MSQEGRLTDRLPGIALFLARLYVGYWFLLTGIGKIKRGFLSDGALLPQLERFAAGTPHASYKAWLESIVIPHEHLFAALVALVVQLRAWGFRLFDCQTYSRHAERLGASPWPRRRFLEELRAAVAQPTRQGRWSFDPVLVADGQRRL